MKSEIIEKMATEIANELIERTTWDKQNIVSFISVRLRSNFDNILQENATKEEREWMALVEEQSTYKINTPQYVKCGFKLGLARSRKTIANRTANNIKKAGIYERMRNFIIEKHGIDVVYEIVHKEVIDLENSLDKPLSFYIAELIRKKNDAIVNTSEYAELERKIEVANKLALKKSESIF